MASMGKPDPAIKQELSQPPPPDAPTIFTPTPTPITTTTTPSTTSTFASILRPSSPFKRSFSPEQKDTEASKRQRLEAATSNGARILENDDFMRILAQATANTNLQIEKSRPVAPSPQPVVVAKSDRSQNVHAHSIGNGNGNGHGNVNVNAFQASKDPYLYMRVLSLPVLESLSTQILAKLAQDPLSDTIKLFSEPSSEQAQAYATLKSLFQTTKKIFTSTDFLSADQLNIRDESHRRTIRLTNVATFAASVFSGQDVGFQELHNNFVNVFCPENQPLTQEVGIMYLDLKTQMFLACAFSEDQARSKEELLDDLYSLDPQASLDPLRSRPTRPLVPSEIEFLQAVRARRTFLREQPYSAESIQDLSEKFPWEGFLHKLTIHLRNAYEPLVSSYMKKHSLPTPIPPPAPVRSIEHDISAETERAIQAALLSISSASNPPPPPQQPSNVVSTQQSEPPKATTTQLTPPTTTQYEGNSVPFPTQSAPTQVLYERARQAAAAKSNPGSARRPGLPSQRRPWTNEEENALMTGLDQVKGPHWSQILSLYGTNGTISEVLKDRNQVQLKDKARNLKLFFLKSNIEVPYYLQSVTGELKTRAPSQAAKREAQEQRGLTGDEERQRAEGIMALANGFKDENGTDGFFDSDDGELEDQEFESLDEDEHEMDESPVVFVKQEEDSNRERDADDVLREHLLAANAAQDEGGRGSLGAVVTEGGGGGMQTPMGVAAAVATTT